jgi:predicted nucleic acid-binding protein
MTVERRVYLAEPPAQYLVQPPLVIDCSLLAAMVFDEPARGLAEGQIVGRNLHAPFLLQCEIANVAVKKHRRGEADATQAMAVAATIDIGYLRINPHEAAQLALRYQLSAYDAAYLWLAADLTCPLATFDQRLAEAARSHLASLGSPGGLTP